MSNYIQFELFLIISIATVCTQYIINFTKTMKLKNLIQENILNLI